MLTFEASVFFSSLLFSLRFQCNFLLFVSFHCVFFTSSLFFFDFMLAIRLLFYMFETIGYCIVYSLHRHSNIWMWKKRVEFDKLQDAGLFSNVNVCVACCLKMYCYWCLLSYFLFFFGFWHIQLLFRNHGSIYIDQKKNNEGKKWNMYNALSSLKRADILTQFIW